MSHKIINIPVCALVVTAILSAPGLAGTSEIAVCGFGIAAVDPDYATMDIPIWVMRDKADEASRAAAARYDSLLNVLNGFGILEKDYSTIKYNISASYKRNDRGEDEKFRGYVASHVLQVRVRDLELVGRIVDASVRVGINQISEIRFYSSKADSLSRAALDEAVRDAHERAKVMAAALGGSLGSLIEMTTRSAASIKGRDFVEEERVEAIAFKGGIVRVAPRDVTVRNTVIGRWEFIETK